MLHAPSMYHVVSRDVVSCRVVSLLVMCHVGCLRGPSVFFLLQVKSRSSDEECVVAQLDQWYLEYGEPSWRAVVEAHMHSGHFQTFDPQVAAQFDAAVSWFGTWACSRWFGLGTKLPWDPQFVIESLSDSTIYMCVPAGPCTGLGAPRIEGPFPMSSCLCLCVHGLLAEYKAYGLARCCWFWCRVRRDVTCGAIIAMARACVGRRAYYTIAHLLQGGVLDGSVEGKAGVHASQLTDDVWNHIFLDAPVPAACGIPEATLAVLKKEFSFWYPLDLRVSGKDLIKNHLIMSLYNHAAIWNGRPDRMPQGFFTNGHVLVDGDKMSKSAGNFITMQDGIARWSADAYVAHAR